MLYFNSEYLVEGSTFTSSKGNQSKWQTRDGSLYIKECFYYQGRVWRDDLVEIIASKYASFCALEDFGVCVLKQEACTVDGRQAVCSKNFCTPTQVFIPFKRLCDKNGISIPNYLQSSPKDNFALLSSLYTAFTGLNAHYYLLAMAVLDSVVGNEDRHYNNFGVLYDTSDKSYSLPPLFDFGLGLFEHDARYDGLSYKSCIQLMQCKPFTLENDRLISFLAEEHKDFLSAFLPLSIEVSDFVFPSENAESYFRNRNILLGVKLR